MKDPRIEKLADVLVRYSVEIKPGDRLAISSSEEALPLVRAIYARALQLGALPMTLINLSDGAEILYRNASDEQLQHIHEPIRMIYETYDALITIWAPANTKSLTSIDPARMVLRSRAESALTQTFLRRIADKSLRWVGTGYPNQAYAQDAEMSLSEYEDFVFSACMPDADDPVGYWKRFSAWQQKIVDWMEGRQTIHVMAPDTDLRLNIAGRRFINCDGHENMPDGEVFTGPVEDSVEGHVYFSYPTVYDGRELTGVRLWFEKGKVVKASADKNEDFLLKMLDTDPGARHVGEFAIGTNMGIQRFTREILYDEKIGGSFHMALGAGLPESGSKNESAIHWDMICDMRQGGQIHVDDILLYKDGRFVVDF